MMIWWVFLGCSIVTGIFIPFIFFAQNIIIQNIALSIISAYIFYLFLEFIPSLIKRYDDYALMASCYRKLQLMLNRLDNLFLEPYKKTHMSHDINTLNLEKFFNKNSLSFLVNFDLSQDSNSVGLENFQLKLPFSQYLLNEWKECKFYAQKILQNPYVQTNPKLYYEIQYILYESSICKYFYISEQYNSHIDYGQVLALNSSPENIEKHIQNIIKIHKIAFKLYDNLKNKKRFENIIKPKFYKN